MHWLLNIVTDAPGYPAAVLIRGAGSVEGPGRLTKTLGIDKALDGEPCTRASGLWLEAGDAISETDIERTPRIGIDYAGEDWARRPYRFVWTAGSNGA